MIVCFGGAFNPPTSAHLNIYKTVKKEVAFTRFIYMPVSDFYHKPLVSSHHRYAMLKSMTNGYDDILVDDYELNLQTFKGTYHTLTHLKSKYQDEVAFVCGMDQALTINQWINADALKKMFKFIIITRKGYDSSRIKGLFKKMQIIEYDFPISSTQFRKTNDFTLLEPSVSDYIKTHHLYEDAYV